MHLLLGTILSYLVSLAANFRSAAVHAAREEKLRDVLEKRDLLKRAIASLRPFQDDLRTACADLARQRNRLGVSREEEPVWNLLSDDEFQSDLCEWFRAGAIEEGTAVKSRLLRRIEAAVATTAPPPEQIAFLRSEFFDAVEKAVFSQPALAHWRHQLSLDYLREQVAILRRRAEEAAGVYAPDKQINALARYSEKALSACDIIDLSNLPEGDIQLATQKLLLRQLYMPLRVAIEQSTPSRGSEARLASLEEQREVRRRREAGHLYAAEPDEPVQSASRFSVGERLSTSRRLVILGDPGGGKTTLLRWLATSYLLRCRGDAAFDQIPDTHTLPLQLWIPVLIRCRDLGQADLCRSFTDFLSQHLYKTELLPQEADVMRAVILDRIARGEVLLLVDGLDEITDPQVRMMFSQELERTAARYPDVPIVVTSRIVGYRDMPYRMRAGFEHGVIAELSREDKDLFAKRWVEVTEQHLSIAERERRTQDLLDALNSNERVGGLTGNPMLLTTLALVKRKVGKLPNRRNKLYAEAVSVLLNWNPRLYETIEEDEAIPQLEYLAYEMCRRGVQLLPDDEVLDLLEGVRDEYPNVRAIRRRDPRAFLALLEARSSILIRSGGVWQSDVPRERRVWEFRHLTFQEFLAGRALLDGRYPGRDKSKSLAEQVGPLAGAVQRIERRRSAARDEPEADVPESWLEALRLLVADCKDDDVDDVLLSILTPGPGEDSERTGRPRAALAALCLADEPNVSEDTAKRVLSRLVHFIDSKDGGGRTNTSVDHAAVELGASIWAELLRRILIEDFCSRPPETRGNSGGLLAMAELSAITRYRIDLNVASERLRERLHSSDRAEILSAALAVMGMAFDGYVPDARRHIERLVVLLERGGPEAHAAAWALLWLSGGFLPSSNYQYPQRSTTPTWVPAEMEARALIRALENAPVEESILKRFLIHTLGRLSIEESVDSILARLGDVDADVRSASVLALGQLGNRKAVSSLLAKLDDASVRSEVVAVLGVLGDPQAVLPLVDRLVDATVRRLVIRALGQLGDRRAVPQVLAQLERSDSEVRRSAVLALGEMGDVQVVPALLSRLGDDDIRSAVVRTLGKLGDVRAVAPLLARLKDAASEDRADLVRALGRLGDRQAVEPLVPLLQDPDHHVCAAAAAALCALGDGRGSRALPEFLGHSSPVRRMAAVKELVGLRCQQKEDVIMSRDFDGADPWLDPATAITEGRIAALARRLQVTHQDSRRLYESLATDFQLRFA